MRVYIEEVYRIMSPMTSTNILMDIGNSTMEIAVSDGEQFLKRKSIPTSKSNALGLRTDLKKADRVIISSVVPEIDRIYSELENVTWVTYRNSPLKLDIETPSEVGSDRLVNAYGAIKTYGKNCIVVDSGTALTFCYVTTDNVYHGGVIIPGMRIASKALNEYTAKLPLIYVDPQENLIGKTTKKAVKSGLYFSYLDSITGLIRRFKAQDKNALVIGTGKGLDIFKDKIGLDHYDPDLIL